uniref:protein-tyrosine-phosphatase n=1 Tax=Chrysemys picta bellii TaxID=8478 RepID=A0A8C3I4N5_CHRPI
MGHRIYLCSVPEENSQKYRVPNLLNSYQQHGIIVHHHPILDGDTPDIANCCTILEELRGCLENNRKTLIHCYGGLGRSCLSKHLFPPPPMSLLNIDAI